MRSNRLGLVQIFPFCICFGIVILIVSSLAVVNAKSISSQEESKTDPLKIVVSLDYTEKQLRDGIGKILVSYEDSDGFKKVKEYDIDRMIKNASPDPVKVQTNFPSNTVTDYEDYLICVTVVGSHHDKCVNESRSPLADEESLHIPIP